MLGTPELLLTFWEPKLFLVELHCSKNLSGTLTRFQAFWLPGVPTSAAAAAAAKSVQSCLTLCDPTDGSPAGSAIPGILQARTLEWVALTFSNAWKWKVKVKSLSRVRLLATPWTAAHQTPPSMGFSRQEYWKCPVKKQSGHALLFWGEVIQLQLNFYWTLAS